MNLSETKNRDVQQLEQIGRRDSIVPDRRNTRAPEFQPQADLRSAKRGDGGAAELLRTLGIVEKGVDSFKRYQDDQFAVDEQKNIARGFVDQQTGAVDQGMIQKSEGYRNAVTKGRTMTEFSAAMRDFDKDLRGFIEQQDDPDLGVRREQVTAKLEEFYHNFAVDPETKQLKSFLQSPGAMRYLAETIQQSRKAVTDGAMERIESRFNTEAVNHFATVLADQAERTGTVDLNQALSVLPKTVPEETVRSTIVTTLNTSAEALKRQGRYVEALQLLDGALGKKAVVPAGGVPAAPEGTPGAPTASLAASKPAAAPTGRVSFDVLAAAVMKQESGGRTDAVSVKGALGQMQTMPGTLRDPGFGVTAAKDNSPAELTRVGRDYLKAMLKRYNGDYVLALAAYNAGPGRADDWKAKLAGKSTAQRIAMIPFEETRNYVKNILGNVGVTSGGAGAPAGPGDPVQADPTFKLVNHDEDPVTAYERDGTATPLTGIAKLNLSPVDMAKLSEARDQLASQARIEWTKKHDEQQGFNASSMALRLYGQGAPLTSTEITESIRTGAISANHGMTLYGLLRQNANQAQSDADRQLSLADRAERKQVEDESAAISGKYVGMILSGKMSGPEARAAALKELPRIRNPKVRAAVANTVLATSTDVENLRNGSAPVRDAARRFSDKQDEYLQRATSLGGRSTAAGQSVNAIFGQMQSDYSVRLGQGIDPAQAEAEVVAKYRPRLEAAVTKPAARTHR